MPLPDHLHADLHWRWAAVGGPPITARTRLYYIVSAGSLTAANANDMANSINAFFAGACKAVTTVDWKMDRVRIRYTNAGTEIEGESTDVNGVGDQEGETLPEHDTVCIRRKTNTTGRARRGRVFIPFVPEELATNVGELTPAGVTVYGNLASKILQTIVSAGTGVTLIPQQPSFKLGLFLPVKRCEVVLQVVTRKDRQNERERSTVTRTS